MKTYTLPISPDYIEHWGLWEAVREILQNAFDQEEKSLLPCEVKVDITKTKILISTSTGRLDPATLVLGCSSKRKDENQRGKFGEGYKLALLVLTRLGHSVTITHGNKLWIPKLEKDYSFDSVVLKIDEYEKDDENGVSFEITLSEPTDIDGIKSNIIDLYGVLEDQPGRIYVGGLYVCTVENYSYGYSFKPGEITLNRDRNLVDGFDLDLASGRKLAEAVAESPEKASKVLDMMHEGKADSRFMHCLSDNRFATIAYASYRVQEPEAIPVSTQEEVQKAMDAGVKWKLVPDSVKQLFKKVATWFIPSTKSPLERLKELQKKLHGEYAIELADIIKQMEAK